MMKLATLEHELDPFPLYREMRANKPVYYNTERGSWNVFRYDDVQRVLSEYETFSSQFGPREGADSDMPFAASMIATDPPRHRQLRGLVTQAFTPRAVNALAPRISALVDEYLDAVMPNGHMDVIRDFGYPLPVTVIAAMMGIPAEDRDKFKHWSDQVVSSARFGEQVDVEGFMGNGAVMEMAAYFMEIIEQRTAQPGEDLISGLIAANIDGERLNMIELLGFCVLLLVAGNETTTNLIGNALQTFAEHPDVWERLRREPDMIGPAIEEVLRFRSPVQSMFRVVARDTELRGQKIREGSPMVAWIGSANHDEAQFEEPERFDIDRAGGKHIAFGHGIHYCLGAPLARLEARIALEAMTKRFSSIAVEPNARFERLPSQIVFGLRSLPIVFEHA